METWANEMQLVVDEGRALVHELGNVMDGSLPLEDIYIQDIWRSGMDIIRQILEGISMLETHLEIVAPFPDEDLVELAVRRIKFQ